MDQAENKSDLPLNHSEDHVENNSDLSVNPTNQKPEWIRQNIPVPVNLLVH